MVRSASMRGKQSASMRGGRGGSPQIKRGLDERQRSVAHVLDVAASSDEHDCRLPNPCALGSGSPAHSAASTGPLVCASLLPHWRGWGGAAGPPVLLSPAALKSPALQAFGDTVIGSQARRPRAPGRRCGWARRSGRSSLAPLLHRAPPERVGQWWFHQRYEWWWLVGCPNLPDSVCP